MPEDDLDERRQETEHRDELRKAYKASCEKVVNKMVSGEFTLGECAEELESLARQYSEVSGFDDASPFAKS